MQKELRMEFNLRLMIFSRATLIHSFAAFNRSEFVTTLTATMERNELQNRSLLLQSTMG